MRRLSKNQYWYHPVSGNLTITLCRRGTTLALAMTMHRTVLRQEAERGKLLACEWLCACECKQRRHLADRRPPPTTNLNNLISPSISWVVEGLALSVLN